MKLNPAWFAAPLATALSPPLKVDDFSEIIYECYRHRSIIRLLEQTRWQSQKGTTDVEPVVPLII